MSVNTPSTLAKFLYENYKNDDHDYAVWERLTKLMTEKPPFDSDGAEEAASRFYFLSGGLKEFEGLPMDPFRCAVLQMMENREMRKVIFNSDFFLPELRRYMGATKVDSEMFYGCMALVFNVMLYVYGNKKRWKRLEQFGYINEIMSHFNDPSTLPAVPRKHIISSYIQFLGSSLLSGVSEVEGTMLNALEMHMDTFLGLAEDTYKRVIPKNRKVNDDVVTYTTVLLVAVMRSKTCQSAAKKDKRLYKCLFKMFKTRRNQKTNFAQNIVILHDHLVQGQKLNRDALRGFSYARFDEEGNGTSNVTDIKILQKESKRCGVKQCPETGVTAKLSLCAGCKSVYYCSRKCQKEDWKAHKKPCRELQKKRAS